MLQIRPAKEVKGKVALPPNPDFILPAAVGALAAQKQIRIAPVADTPLTQSIGGIISSFADIATEGDAWTVTPKADTEAVIKIDADNLRFREFIIFALLGLKKTVAFDALSEKRFEIWQHFARKASCEIGRKEFDDGSRGIFLVSDDTFSLTEDPIEANMLHALFGLAMGLGRTINAFTEYQFISPLRHMLPALGYNLNIKAGGDGKDGEVVPRRLKFLRPKKKSEQGISFNVSADFASPSLEPSTIAVPGDDILGSILGAVKSLVQKGNLIIENCLLEPWSTPMLGLVRKMGCRPAIQEQEESSFGRTGLIQLQRFEIAGRKTECIPLYQYLGHLPSMVVVSCFAQGQSVFRALENLRDDNLDGIERILECVRSLGGRHGEMPDGIVIDGAKQIDGFDLDKDYPAAISGAFAIAGLKCVGSTTVADSAIFARWPNFDKMLDKICEYRK